MFYAKIKPLYQNKGVGETRNALHPSKMMPDRLVNISVMLHYMISGY